MAYLIACINDTHHPLHDEKAINLVLDILHDVQPEIIVLNGDIADFYSINMHNNGEKHPDVQFRLEDEFISVREFLETLREKCPNSKIIYNAGNHEWRLDRFIIQKAKPFWGMMTVEKQLRLSDLEIIYRPYNRALKLDNIELYIQHSPPSYGENGARTSLLKKNGSSWIWGCTHRLQAAHTNLADGTTVSGFFNGWLGSIDATPEHSAVFEFVRGHDFWQKGFSLIAVDGKHFFVDQILIKDYSCYANGAFYSM